MSIKIPIKKYAMDETLSWEERYKRLDAHHLEETQFLIEELKKRETILQAAIVMQKRRGWAFTVREDLHGDEWLEVEKLIRDIAEKGS